jgi:hypothetical protein
MKSLLLSLHFSQLSKAWYKARNNHYSDERKNKYQEALGILFEKISTEDFNTLNENQLLERQYVFDFFFKSLEFLNSSTFTQFPFEIVKCLEISLKEWVDNCDDFIIVTSLVNTNNAFSFDSSLVNNDSLYNLMGTLYDVSFEAKLIQINLPKFLSRDYLSNVVLYHELGHFVDTGYKISEAIIDTILLTKNLNDDFPNYFEIDFGRTDLNRDCYKNHIAEFFCDVFASQYIGETSNYYLGYITMNDDNDSYSHPSTTSRIKFVKDFLCNSNENPLLNLMKEATLQITGKELKIRHTKFTSDDFSNLIPVDIKSESELHYLFVYGWQMWLKKLDEVEQKNKMGFELERSTFYGLINNLIEKSIGNFIVTELWENSKK